MNIKLLEKTASDFQKTASALTAAVRSLADLRHVRECVAKGNPATLLCGETPFACANFRILSGKHRAGIVKELRREQNDCATDVATLCAKLTQEIETIVFALDDVGEI